MVYRVGERRRTPVIVRVTDWAAIVGWVIAVPVFTFIFRGGF